MARWKITGIIATLVIILSIPLYWIKENYPIDSSGKTEVGMVASFVGTDKCRYCHKQEFDKWSFSHHRFAMTVATEETVLGDFGDTEFEHFGVMSMFYRKDGKFFVHTQGPGGEMGDFEITHTFGWYPLQQYLIPFPGGRLQCLPIAWDVEKKRWYHLYSDAPPDPDDWLYWTNQAQNWNGMCAECHSTNLKKNYNPSTDIYQTTWSEVSVGCEACHGPGSEHVKWAELPEMGRPPVQNYALTVQTGGLTPQQQIELCAPCHSRRMSLGENPHQYSNFLDYAVPQLLSEGYYFADGQILEEVYVYGSFMQSKMYDRQVRCSDCHDVHDIRRIKEGNDLCLQCHKAAIYDTRDHHFHKKKGEEGEPVKSKTGEILFEVGTGAQCEQCHMPGRYYMGIDYRPDHSFRIPRPDLTLTIDIPNGCNRCHVDKNARWSVDTLLKWYGMRKRSHYGTILSAGRLGKSEALPNLIHLAQDRLYPSIVRATALSLLPGFPGKEANQVMERSLADEQALIRYAAVRHLTQLDPLKRLQVLGPLLYDPVKAVRMEAANSLRTTPRDAMTETLRKQFEIVLSEYESAMEYTADFAPSRHNLANLYVDLGQENLAVENYLKAIEIDDGFYPAKVNLAMLYNRQGKNEQAEQLLREVVTAHPDLYEINYSLGLLLAEMNQYESAVPYFRHAAEGLPKKPRIHYNLGILLQHLHRDEESEMELNKALAIEPENPDYLYALAVFYLQRNRLDEAEQIAEKMIASPTSRSIGDDLLKVIQRQRSVGAGIRQ